MFGYERGDGDDCPWTECEDEYYFYMRFQPYADITAASGEVFRIWFQIGGSTSDWHGVEYTSDGAMGTATDLEPVSSTNSNFASNQSFDNDSEFRGQLLNDGTYEAIIWRYIPRWE